MKQGPEIDILEMVLFFLGILIKPHKAMKIQLKM